MTDTAFDTKRVIVVLDFPDAQQARELVARLDPKLCRVKVGKELFTSSGPSFVEELIAQGFDVFLDLKYHDIPNTVAKAVMAAAQLGVWMVNVHASGGRAMMEAAREAVDACAYKPLLIAVTVLTSMTESDLIEVGVSCTAEEQVLKLARLAKDCGMDGVVCSAAETSILASQLGKEFVLVTPGIRPAGDAVNDQKRVVTPVDAIAAGSHYLVIGRPITQAANPSEKLQSILEQLDGKIGNLC